MAKNKNAPSPLYPLAHEYERSLTNTLEAAGSLLTAVETILSIPEALPPRVVQILRGKADDLDVALYGHRSETKGGR